MPELVLTRSEKNDLYTVAEGTGDGYLHDLLGERALTTERDITHVRDAAARALESGAARRHGLDTLEGVYDRATEKVFGPDPEFDFS